MKNNFFNLSILLLSILCLMISVKLFWNLSIYVDQYNTSPNIVFGGHFWNYAHWLTLLINFLIIVLSAANFIKKKSI